MNSKIFGILFGNFINDKNKPFNEKKLDNCFKEITLIGRKKGMDIVIAKTAWYNNQKFIKAWIYNKRWKIIKDVYPNLILNKYDYTKKTKKFRDIIHKEIGFLNHPNMEVMSVDKFFLHKKFPHYSPKTLLAHNRKQLIESIKKIKTKKYVIKPRYGWAGIGIKFFDKDNIPKKVKKDTIVQEFVDASDGIKSMNIKGNHDFRVLVINGKIKETYVRQPKKDSLLSNVAQGGKLIRKKVEDIPGDVVKIVKEVDNEFKEYKSRLYTIDFMFRKGKPLLIEMNSSPSLYLSTKKFYKDMISAMQRGLR